VNNANARIAAATQLKFSRRIGVRVVIASLLGSIVISTLMSVLQICYTYQQTVQSAQQRFLQIETSYLPSLVDNLWEVNQAGVDALLDGIASLPDVGRVELIDETRKIVVRNENAGDSVGQRQFMLRYRRNESSYDVGTLRVDLTDQQIVAQLKSRAVDIGAMLSIALFINSMMVLALLYRMIMRHFNSIARFASTVDVASIGLPLVLQRPPHDVSTNDELDQVVDALNAMRSRLREELARRTAVEHDLRLHQENLEALITERTLAYNASAAQLTIAADVAELGVWSMDLKTGALTWSPRMFEIYAIPPGFRKDGMTMPAWIRRVHPDDSERTVSALRRAIDTQTLYANQFRIISDAGLCRHIRGRALVICAASGEPVTVIGINYDITEQIEIENHLKRAKDEAEEGARAKAEFLAAMSHEIRTPMNGVLGMLNLLQRTDLDQEQQRRLQIARNSADHLLTVINDILDFSKIDAGKLAVDAIDFDLVQQIGDSVQSLSLRAQEKGLELVVDVEAVSVAWVRGDPARLRQILVNLIGNAIKFTERGEVVVRCRQQIEADSILVTVTINDTGIGIAEEKIAGLFAAFTQGDTSMTRRFGGTGLGLVISKKLCELMGGDIGVSSTVAGGSGESGSCFTFTVRFAVAQTQAAMQAQFDGRGADILVVDDNATSRELLGRQLAGYGATVTLAAGAQDALEICERRTRLGTEQVFDVGIIDLHMPVTTGIELGLRLMEDSRWSHLKLILMTGVVPHEELQHAASLSFRAMLPKPVMPRALQSCIAQVLSGGNQSDAFFTAMQPARPAAHPPMGGRHDNASAMQLPAFFSAKTRVLLVEDNAVNQNVASLMLTDLGLDVDLTSNGREAIELLRTTAQPYALILMDCQMPEMDGFAASRAIRNAEAGELHRDVTIVALTANAMTGDRERCLAAGMNDYLAKPLDDKTLLDKLQQWLPRADVAMQPTVASASIATNISLSQTGEPPTAAAVWDESAALSSLKGRRDRLQTLIKMFLRGLPDQLAGLERGSAVEDFEKIIYHAHTLRGSAGQLRALQVHDLARTLEQSARDRSADCWRYTKELTRAIETLIPVLEGFCADS